MQEAEAPVVLNALPTPVLVVAPGGRVRFANPAAEQLLEIGASALLRLSLDDLVPGDSAFVALVAQAIETGSSMSEYGVTLSSPRVGAHLVDIHVGPIPEWPGHAAVVLQPCSAARRLDRQLSHRRAARSAEGFAAVLAHEVKNPLSGIRGAAQLLDQSAEPEQRMLTRLICDETDRICALFDRMDLFAAAVPPARDPVNIHSVLERVLRVAQSGFARGLRFIEQYDPSLPPVQGDRDRLIQVFLNLVKNAAEAVKEGNGGGEIVLSTAYRHGLRLTLSNTRERMDLPIVVSVQDDGPGIRDDIMPHLFEPFVTGRKSGSGLGLSLVAKIVGDHGGVIEYESEPRRTVFRVLLPAHRG